MQAQEKAQKLLTQMSTIFLVTLKDDGFPNARAISATKAQDIKTIYMISGLSNPKSTELKKNPHCMIYTTTLDDNCDYVELRLWGKAELLTDMPSREYAWNNAYNEYFKQGINDPELCVIKFTTDHAQITTPEGTQHIDL